MGGNRLDATDYEIIKICLSGQQEAFSELVTRYKKLIHNVIYNLSGGKSEVSDLAQDVFIRIYRSLHRYNPDYRFATWAIKIATNVYLDWNRQNKMESVAVENIAEISDNRSNPEEQHLKDEEMGRLRKAINELPEKYRLPVVLFHQQGLSYKDLEEVLNLPVSIVKNRLYRARISLKGRLCLEEE